MNRETSAAGCDVLSQAAGQGAAALCAATLCVDEETAAAVRQAMARKNGIFAGELQDYASYSADLVILQRLQRTEVSTCLIDFDRDRARAVETAMCLQQQLHGHTALIALSSQSDPALILQAMRAGCCEYLTKPLAVDQLCDALDRLRARSGGQKPAPAKTGGKILALLGARGGAGTTTLAVHLGCF